MKKVKPKIKTRTDVDMHTRLSKVGTFSVVSQHERMVDKNIELHPLLSKPEFKPLIALAQKVHGKHTTDVEGGATYFRKSIKKIRDGLLDGKTLKDNDNEIAQNDYFNDLTKANKSNEAWDFFKKSKDIDEFDNTNATVEFYKEYVNAVSGGLTPAKETKQLKIKKSTKNIFGIDSVERDSYLDSLIEPFRKMREFFDENGGIDDFTGTMKLLLQDKPGKDKWSYPDRMAFYKRFGYDGSTDHTRVKTLLKNFSEIHKITDKDEALTEFSKFMYANAGENNFGNSLDSVYFPQNMMKNKEFDTIKPTSPAHTQHKIEQQPHKIDSDTPDFPKKLDELEVVRNGLGGSNGARLVRDNKTKNLYVLKDGVGRKAQQLIEEDIADSVYKFFGTPMAKSKIYKGEDGKVSKLSEYIDGLDLSEQEGNIHPDTIKQLQNGFATDALLSNYDVIGLVNDNIKVDRNNVPYRIDNGGALRFTGTGRDKSSNFTDTISDLWSLRKKNNLLGKRNSTVINAHDIYDSMSYDDVMGQVGHILSKRDSLMEHLKGKGADSELLGKMGSRLDSMQEYHHMYTQMRVNDKYKPEYIDRLSEIDNVLTEHGVFKSLPTALSMPTNNKAYNLIDSSGVPFGGIRGKDGARDRFFSELSKINDTYDIENGTTNSAAMGDMVKTYLSESADSAWNDVPVFFKKLFTNNLNTNLSYIDGKKIQIPRVMQDVSSDFGLNDNNDKALLALQSLHAFTYKTLRTTDMPFNNKENGTIRLMRTVTKKRLQNDLIGIDDTPKSGTYYEDGMMEEPLESYSQIQRTAVDGEELTIQDVPHHNNIYHYSMGAYYDGDKHGYDDESETIAFHSHSPIKYNNDAVNSEFGLPTYDRNTPLNLV